MVVSRRVSPRAVDRNRIKRQIREDFRQSVAELDDLAVGDRILGEKDSRRLVWDELAGFMIAVAFVPFTWQLALLAFVLERAFDVLKIPPANLIENHWPRGWGVVCDDIVAGLYTCGILHLLLYFKPSLGL